MVIKMRVKELAEARGLNISSLSMETRINLLTCRRLWYSTNNGSETGDPLVRVDLDVLERLCAYFNLQPGDFFVRIEDQK